jgi:hypothetical protein
MKAREHNGNITTYNSLPETWNGSDGHIMNFRNASTEVVEAEGFFDVQNPDGYDGRIHDLTDLTFDSEDNVFVYSKEDKTWSETLAELKASKITSLKSIYNSELSKTDWIIVRDSELGNTTEQSVKDSRAALRTECATKEAEINALTSKANVITYQLPNLNV